VGRQDFAIEHHKIDFGTHFAASETPNGNNPRENSTLVEFTSAIVTAHVSHNAISAADIGKLIDDVHSAVKATMRPNKSEIDKEQVPAISIGSR
jgi:predicted transcriptional regulator